MEHSALSVLCINWYYLNFSLDKHLGGQWELQELVGETQSVCLVPTHGPAHWWTDPPAQLQRKSPRTSLVWFAKAATVRTMMSL